MTATPALPSSVRRLRWCCGPTRCRPRGAALVFLSVLLTSSAPQAGLVSPPEVGWRLLPGDADGSEDSQTAALGPIGAMIGNGLPGVQSDGGATADYGTLAARTATSVNAGAQSGESFCFPVIPAPQCSESEVWWADRLVFSAPGAVANGTAGSFTAQIAVSGQLAAALSASWDFVTVESDYQVLVSVDGAVLEQIAVSCIALPISGMACIPVPLQIHFGNPPLSKTPPMSGFGAFQLGPYDFVWGEPFDFEVIVRANTTLDSAGQSAGTSSASADLGATLTWNGISEMFDGPGGTGAAVALASARVAPASGVDWLVTVEVPEPQRSLSAAAVLASLITLSGIGWGSRAVACESASALPRRAKNQ